MKMVKKTQSYPMLGTFSLGEETKDRRDGIIMLMGQMLKYKDVPSIR